MENSNISFNFYRSYGYTGEKLAYKKIIANIGTVVDVKNKKLRWSAHLTSQRIFSRQIGLRRNLLTADPGLNLRPFLIDHKDTLFDWEVISVPLYLLRKQAFNNVVLPERADTFFEANKMVLPKPARPNKRYFQPIKKKKRLANWVIIRRPGFSKIQQKTIQPSAISYRYLSSRLNYPEMWVPEKKWFKRTLIAGIVKRHTMYKPVYRLRY